MVAVAGMGDFLTWIVTAVVLDGTVDMPQVYSSRVYIGVILLVVAYFSTVTSFVYLAKHTHLRAFLSYWQVFLAPYHLYSRSAAPRRVQMLCRIIILVCSSYIFSLPISVGQSVQFYVLVWIDIVALSILFKTLTEDVYLFKTTQNAYVVGELPDPAHLIVLDAPSRLPINGEVIKPAYVVKTTGDDIVSGTPTSDGILLRGGRRVAVVLPSQYSTLRAWLQPLDFLFETNDWMFGWLVPRADAAAYKLIDAYLSTTH